MEPQQETSEQIEGEKTIAVRRTPIVRGRQSYRPGQPIPQFEFRQLALHIYIPISTAMGTDEEWTAVRQFAQRLQDYKDVGEVTALGMGSGEFKIEVHLRGLAAMNEDHMLTTAFLRLKPMLEASDLIRDGLTQLKPHWKAVKGGDFVADEGEL